MAIATMIPLKWKPPSTTKFRNVTAVQQDAWFFVWYGCWRETEGYDDTVRVRAEIRPVLLFSFTPTVPQIYRRWYYCLNDPLAFFRVTKSSIIVKSRGSIMYVLENFKITIIEQTILVVKQTQGGASHILRSWTNSDWDPESHTRHTYSQYHRTFSSREKDATVDVRCWQRSHY